MFEGISANKYTIDYREKIEGVPHSIWVVLADAKIATQVGEKEFFDTCMHHGCFIENEFYRTRETANRRAIELAKELDCRFVTPEEFRRIEKESNEGRVQRAFAEAERLIRES